MHSLDYLAKGASIYASMVNDEYYFGFELDNPTEMVDIIDDSKEYLYRCRNEEDLLSQREKTKLEFNKQKYTFESYSNEVKTDEF